MVCEYPNVWQINANHPREALSISVHGLHGTICDFQDAAAWYESYAGATADYYKRYMDKDLPWGSRLSGWESNGVNMKTTFHCYTLLNNIKQC